MRKIIVFISFFMMLGQVGNAELSATQPLSLGQVIKFLILFTIFYFSIRKYLR